MARKKKKQSQGVYYLILFICAVCLAYEPVAKILSDARQKNSTPAKIELTAGTRLEIPAKLKNVSEQILQRERLHSILQQGFKDTQLGSLGTHSRKTGGA